MILDRASRHLNVVERDGVIGELLIIFVSFARDQYDVARLSQFNRALDRFGAIDHFFVVSRAKSFFDLSDDCVRIFFARIVGRDDGVVGILIDHFGHQAVASAGRDRRRNRKRQSTVAARVRAAF